MCKSPQGFQSRLSNIGGNKLNLKFNVVIHALTFMCNLHHVYHHRLLVQHLACGPPMQDLTELNNLNLRLKKKILEQ